jgi:hypothetical protein
MAELDLPLLAEALSPQQQEILSTLAHQPGFEILVKLFDAACIQVTKRLVKLNPDDEDYKEKLEIYHRDSRIVNEFCSSVLSAIEFHGAAVRKRKAVDDQDLEDALAQAAAMILRPGNPYGPNVIKSGA